MMMALIENIAGLVIAIVLAGYLVVSLLRADRTRG